ncbi:XisH family protein [Anabaena cylindrica UHCC 0172]|uniref:XisH family protein n=1 Tax=Anabaena cylindrica TaxID=1165 RepID=UPI002B21CB18|nr:XisH family protein [Anabaena cylindrica]MEA5550564.1 XisH family protein [Anabaena cylindrica UHCC 0172]
MSARDAFHNSVKIALQKDGWRITHDPLSISFGGVDLYIDLGAEKLIAAEKNGEKIAVEIKSFLNTSAISEFHTALGQFLNYRATLKIKEPERILYLAVPLEAYTDFFTTKFTQFIIQEYQLKLIVYNVEIEEIVKWQS